jgi:hypothetical protein
MNHRSLILVPMINLQSSSYLHILKINEREINLLTYSVYYARMLDGSDTLSTTEFDSIKG